MRALRLLLDLSSSRGLDRYTRSLLEREVCSREREHDRGLLGVLGRSQGLGFSLLS